MNVIFLNSYPRQKKNERHSRTDHVKIWPWRYPARHQCFINDKSFGLLQKILCAKTLLTTLNNLTQLLIEKATTGKR